MLDAFTFLVMFMVVAAIYSDKGKALRVAGKVIIRMQTWLNYLFLS